MYAGNCPSPTMMKSSCQVLQLKMGKVCLEESPYSTRTQHQPPAKARWLFLLTRFMNQNGKCNVDPSSEDPCSASLLLQHIQATLLPLHQRTKTGSLLTQTLVCHNTACLQQLGIQLQGTHWPGNENSNILRAANTHARMHARMHMHAHICTTYTGTRRHTVTWSCIHILIHTHMHIHTYRQVHTQTHT